MSAVVCSFKNNQNTRQKEVIEGLKNTLIMSNTLRKYFTSKQYYKIETPLLMNTTGHIKESTFLTYIGTYQTKYALTDLFMKKRELFGNSN